MSTKSTILLTNCCHIYRDKKHKQTATNVNCDDDVLVISVDYDSIPYYNDDESQQDYIVVEWESDFAVLIRAMIGVCDTKELDKLCRDNWVKHNT